MRDELKHQVLITLILTDNVGLNHGESNIKNIRASP